MPNQRSVYYLSDRTGITAETLGHSLLTQFDGFEWRKVSIPFIENEEQAREVAEQINQTAERDGKRPLVFSTIITSEIRRHIEQANCVIYDFFETFIGSMEQELGQPSAHAVGRSHSVHNTSSYFNRISAINYSLSNDDGMNLRNFDKADVILVGVSRSGKTPTCLYMALQYGISAANYPLTEEDMETHDLPKALLPYRDKLFGLTLSAEQLTQIRQERRPNSRYASLEQCELELKWQSELYQRYRLPFIDTTNISIEEISTTILKQKKLKRRLYGE
ncbi:MAG: pyruvate, water dikinase regulatory protein [Thiofilum sp.]|uniref:posphoenolpyruvate synthetase regulatory kinase/phosphorylase PpsR n=1 Tax=Thiofilum sp. TaxID=2212733 RepID=UPI0025D55F14|nr:pyruvate, water dikinase regulatory protein [Thiofilum sp.]MBK8451972.1 kinase/pyrophosphorylase [Thiofilum sp.]